MATPTDTRVAPSAHPFNPTPTLSETFDPAGWLERYKALGGVYVANGKLNLCILVNSQTEEQLAQVREMVAALTEADKAAILAHLNTKEVRSPMTWQEVVAKYEADRDALEGHRYGGMLPRDPGHDEAEQEANVLTSISAKSLYGLIVAPAPDFAALRQKLEIIRTEYGEPRKIFDAIIADVGRLCTQTTTSMATRDDPVSRYWPAFHAFNAEQATEEAYMTAFYAMQEWRPATAWDFVRKFEAQAALGGVPVAEQREMMVQAAIAILGPEARSKETVVMETDRRAFLAAAPIAAVAVALPAAAVVIPADRAAWDAALNAHSQATAEYEAFSPIYDRIYDAWEAGRPSMDGIHWREFPFGERCHVARVMDLDKDWQDFLAGEGKWWWGGSKESSDRAKARRRAALDSVQAFRDAEERHDRESGMDAADKRTDALSDRMGETEAALMGMPAPDLTALRWKLDKIFEGDGTEATAAWRREYVAQTIADYRRLLGGA